MDFFHRLFMFVLGGVAGVVALCSLMKTVSDFSDPVTGAGAGLVAVGLVCGYAFRKWEETL
jgi:hypothetical protein